jgi:hypothetical protein
MVKTRQDSGLTQELFTGLFQRFRRQATIVFDLLKRALTTFQTEIVCQVYAADATLSDSFTDFVAAA